MIRILIILATLLAIYGFIVLAWSLAARRERSRAARYENEEDQIAEQQRQERLEAKRRAQS